jgi:hypothetical protein
MFGILNARKRFGNWIYFRVQVGDGDIYSVGTAGQVIEVSSF